MKRQAITSMMILLGLSVLVGVWARPAGAQGPKPAVIWPAEEIKWSDNPMIKGAKVAVLWGDPKAGAYGALRRIPGGTILALHTHTNDTRVLLVSGIMALSIEGSPAKDLGPGSYAFIPGGVKHSATCKAAVECTYFDEQPGANDIKFVGPQ